MSSPDGASRLRTGDSIRLAHSISASSLHRDYHQPSDEVGKIDFTNMTALIGGLYEVGLEFANSDQRLSWNEKGERALEGGSRRRR